MAKPKYLLQVDIYENEMDYPLVIHQFLGRTQKECKDILAAHMRSDSFLRGCLEKHRYSDVRCRAVLHPVRAI